MLITCPRSRATIPATAAGVSAHVAPRYSAFGGMAFMPTMLTAYWLSSDTVTQPPM